MPVYREFFLEERFNKYEFAADVISLSSSDGESISQNELLSLADVECQKLWDQIDFSYTKCGGDDLLVDDIRKQFYPTRFANEILPIVPQEGIFLAMHSMVQHIRSSEGLYSFEVVCVSPAYQSLYETLRFLDLNVKPWVVKMLSTNGSQNYWNFNVQEFEQMLTERTRLVVFNFPHNPTGYTPCRQRWNSLIQMCQRRNIYVFSDEIYNLLSLRDADEVADPANKPFVLTPACQLYEKAVSLCGLSKCFGLPGLRFGWVVTQNQEVMSGMRNMKNYTTICTPRPIEILALIAIRNRQPLVNRVTEIVKENVTLAKHFFEKNRLWFVWLEPDCGTLAFIRLSDVLLTKFSSASNFCHYMVTKHRLLFISSADLEFSDEYIRIGLGRKDFAIGLEALQNVINSWKIEINGSSCPADGNITDDSSIQKKTIEFNN